MKIKANLNYLRISPRKTRLVIGLIRGMDVKEAAIQLKFLSKRSAAPVLKLLNSAVANAKQNFGVEEDNLFISDIQVNEGRPLKRWRARSRGRAAQILKRTSHIKLVLEPKKEVKLKKTKSAKPEVIKLESTQEVKETPIEKVDEESSSNKTYQANAKSKKKFLNRQIFDGAKKIFRRKSF